jgi:hypothetical protein
MLHTIVTRFLVALIEIATEFLGWLAALIILVVSFACLYALAFWALASTAHAQTKINPNQINGAILAGWTDPISDYFCAGTNDTTTGTISSGTASLVVASASGWRVGMGIAVTNAGTAGTARLITTVKSISGTTLTLATTALATATGQVVYHDDTACLQAAVAADKPIMLRPGDYNVTSAVVFSKPGTTIRGSGMTNDKAGSGVPTFGNAHTIIWNLGTTNNVFDITTVDVNDNPEISNLSIHQHASFTPTAGYAIIIGHTGGSNYIRNVFINKVGILRTLGGLAVVGHVLNSTFSNNFIRVRGGAGSIAMKYSNPIPAGGNYITNNTVNCLTASGCRALSITAGDANTWTGNAFNGGIPVYISDDDDAVGLQMFTGNTIENGQGATSPLILINGNGVDTVTQIAFSGGEIGNNSGGYGIQTTGTARSLSFTGVIFFNLNYVASIESTLGPIQFVGNNCFSTGNGIRMAPGSLFDRFTFTGNGACILSASGFSELTIASFLTQGVIGLDTAVPTGDISFGGLAARTINVERNVTANTAGVALTVQSGGATSAATDKAAGKLTLSSGISTGTGSGTIEFATAKAAASTGTGNNSPAARARFISGGHMEFTGTAPALTSCGGSPAITGNDNTMTVTAGSAATACTITFNEAWTNAPHCNVNQETMSVVNALSFTVSTTAIVLSQTGLAASVTHINCRGHY